MQEPIGCATFLRVSYPLCMRHGRDTVRLL
nr:MAG TPA: hypothetical protein [Bacteriophage sp.]